MDDGIYARIPIAELTLAEAVDQVDDPSWWDNQMAPVLYFYKMSVGDYWSLTVKQHRLLVEFLEKSGLVKDGDS